MLLWCRTTPSSPMPCCCLVYFLQVPSSPLCPPFPVVKRDARSPSRSSGVGMSVICIWTSMMGDRRRRPAAVVTQPKTKWKKKKASKGGDVWARENGPVPLLAVVRLGFTKPRLITLPCRENVRRRQAPQRTAQWACLRFLVGLPGRAGRDEKGWTHDLDRGPGGVNSAFLT